MSLGGNRIRPSYYADAVTVSGKRGAPSAVRGAGIIVLVQGAAALVVAAVLVARAMAGADQRLVNGLGTAAWFALVGAAVLAAGRALVTAKRWGRGLAVFTQLLLLPVAWYLAVDSQRPVFGIPLAIVALTVLILLFSPAAIRWASAGDQAGVGDQVGDRRDPASSANGEPDSR
jgi:peptidoglycan/LPS O-acetylase OafA/YrhL